ncbi:MAG TPA: hypothetical protein VIO33_00210 [Burkholderiaceae bacterium]
MGAPRTELPRRIVELPRRTGPRRKRRSDIGIRVVQWLRRSGILSFAGRHLDPRRHLTALAGVVLLHVLVIWALFSGLSKKTMEIGHPPVETKVIETVRQPPPPEISVARPPVMLEAPPPPFIPPPEIQIETPPEPAITVAATPPAPAPAAPASAAPAPAPEPPRPLAVLAGLACSKLVNPHAPLVPESTGVSGASVEYRAVMRGGALASFEITRLQLRGGNDAKVRAALRASVESAVREYVCANDVPFRQEIEFRFTE